jgi:hypothetical protein
VAELRALGHTGGAAGVLQKGEVVVAERHGIELLSASGRQGIAPAHRFGQPPCRHHLLRMLDHCVRQQALERRQQVAHLGGDHRAHLCVADHLLQRVREIFQHHDGAHIGVLELVLQLSGCVHRVHVHHHHAGAQDAKQRHRILQQVGHHQRDTVTALQPGGLLQPGGKRAAGLVKLAKVHGHAHRPVRRQMRKTLATVGEHVDQRPETLHVDFGGHARRVLCEPGFCHHSCSHRTIVYRRIARQLLEDILCRPATDYCVGCSTRADQVGYSVCQLVALCCCFFCTSSVGPILANSSPRLAAMRRTPSGDSASVSSASWWSARGHCRPLHRVAS